MALDQMVNNIIEGESDKFDIAGIVSEMVNIAAKKSEKSEEKNLTNGIPAYKILILSCARSSVG